MGNINKDLNDPKREEKIEKYKKEIKNRPSQRPMGYIFPKRIKQIVAGETPVIDFYPGAETDRKESPTRKIGDEWVDANGKKWRQNDGWVESISELDAIRSELNKMKKCIKCNEFIYTHLDKKFYNIKKKGV